MVVNFLISTAIICFTLTDLGLNSAII